MSGKMRFHNLIWAVVLWCFVICTEAAAAGPNLGPEMFLPNIHEGFDVFLPSVAYNSKSKYYLMAMQTQSSIGYRYIKLNKVIDTGIVSQAIAHMPQAVEYYEYAQPALAFNVNNNDFLVVFMRDVGDRSTYEIWGQLISWNNASPTYQPQFKIFSWANRSFWTPRVAWNKQLNEYLVVWTALNTITNLTNDVSGVRVSADGHVISTAPIVISEALNPHQIDLTYNPAVDEYLAVWRRMSTPGDGDIMGAYLWGNNASIKTPPGVFYVDTSTKDQMLPSVSTNAQDRYMVVWQQEFKHSPVDNDIYGAEMNTSSEPSGDPIAIETSWRNETRPRVVTKPGSMSDDFVVWQRPTETGEEIYGYRVGYSIDKYKFPVASAAFWKNENPVVAIGNSNYLIAYEGDSAGDPSVSRNIWARILTFERPTELPLGYIQLLLLN